MDQARDEAVARAESCAWPRCRRSPARRVRRLRRVRQRRRRSPDRARPARPAAPRPGGRRHRHLRRQALPFRAPPRPRRRQLQQGRRDRPPQGPHRARPRALLHHRRHHPAQRAAAVRRSRHRRLRARPQRQPDQRAHAAPRPHLLGRHLPVDLRQRGDPAPDGPLPAPARRRALRRGVAADPGCLCLRLPDQRHADRRPRSHRHPARWCWGASATPTCWRRRPARSTSSAPSSCARSRTARS